MSSVHICHVTLHSHETDSNIKFGHCVDQTQPEFLQQSLFHLGYSSHLTRNTNIKHEYVCLPLRYQPDSAHHPLQPHLPPQRPGQQPHHRGPGEEPAHENRHQPVPAVSVRQRPDGVTGLHPLHPHPQPHEGFHLRHWDMQTGHVLHG